MNKTKEYAVNELVHTITSDNGKEVAGHQLVA